MVGRPRSDLYHLDGELAGGFQNGTVSLADLGIEKVKPLREPVGLRRGTCCRSFHELVGSQRDVETILHESGHPSIRSCCWKEDSLRLPLGSDRILRGCFNEHGLLW